MLGSLFPGESQGVVESVRLRLHLKDKIKHQINDALKAQNFGHYAKMGKIKDNNCNLERHPSNDYKLKAPPLLL